jgi:AcrR family transcriptional regulator
MTDPHVPVRPSLRKSAKNPAGRSRRKADLRRVPTQERSKARLERILDVADTVFAQVGYDAATMEEIAARAETSIGSLYQFFPNKKALFAALRTRYLDRAQGLLETMLAAGALERPWPMVLDEIIEAFWRFHCDLPGFRAVWVHQSITAEMLDAGDKLNQVMAARGAEFIGFIAPNVSPARRVVVASALVEMVSALLFVAVRRKDSEAKRLVAETKVMARAYLEAVLNDRG